MHDTVLPMETFTLARTNVVVHDAGRMVRVDQASVLSARTSAVFHHAVTGMML